MQIFYIALLTLVASTIGTITGFGTSTLMVPVLLIFLPLPQTLLIVGLIHFFGDIWKIILFKKGGINWKILLGFGIPGVITSFIGAKMVFVLPNQILIKIIAVLMIIYSLFIMIKPNFELAINYFNMIFGGALSGFLAGLSGVGGAVRGAYLTAFNLRKNVYIFTAGAIALFVDATRIVTYFSNGAKLNNNLLLGVILFIAISFVGAKIAQKIVKKIPEKYFRIIISIFLIAVGIRLLFV